MSGSPSNRPILAGYRYGLARVDVEADDPHVVRWLTEFLTPWFEAGASGAGEFAVRFTSSATAFDACERQHAAATCRPVACFALDSEIISLPGWTEEDGSTVIADTGRRGFYRVRGKRVELVTQPGIPRARVGLMRVVRELAAARVLAQGSVLDIHAAAFAVAEHAVLLVGPKRAGKTTLLANTLASGRATLLANDRVFIDTSRAPGLAVGMPTLVSIQDSTLHLFPKLRRSLHERPALLHAAELESRDVGRFDDDGTPPVFALSPAQFARRLGAPALRCAPIRAIVFPEISPTIDGWSIDRMDCADGAMRLHQCLYGARTSPRSRTVFEEIAGRADDAPTALVNQLANRVAFFRCRLGADAYRDGADAWLRRLPLEPMNEASAT